MLASWLRQGTKGLIRGSRKGLGLPAGVRRLGAVAAAVGVLALLLNGLAGAIAPPPETLQQRQVAALDLPELIVPATPETPERTEEPAEEPATADRWQTETVGKGDTLAAVFNRLDLTARDVHQVVHLSEDTRKLTRIYPGDEIHFRLDEQGRLAELEYQLDETTRLRVSGQEGELSARLETDELVPKVRHASGVIQDSLFLAGRDAGLTDRLIMEMAGLFGWDIDFVLDIRDGDEFHLIYEELFRNGEYLRTGEILGATFVNQGKKFQAIRFETENGVEYFSPDARNMKKAFLRAPLDFAYISSSFNPKRFHPILQRVKAHNGVDYRAPTGTPVYAAGNGKVIASARNKYNGNYVFIQHGNNIVTKYLHFSRRAVKKGQRVKQGQVIGYVGNTGMSQAPHLHYEFLVNGVHRNPRTVKLPKAEPLPDSMLPDFHRTANPLLARLDQMASTMLLAAAD